MQQRALLSSQLAVRLLGGSSAELAATAALLADVGMLVPGVRIPAECAAGQEDKCSGPHYAEAGAYLLGLWGLPMPIVEAVASHHQPGRSRFRGFWVGGAVHVARALVSGEDVDEKYLESVGLRDRLPGWRKMADELLAAEAA
jgi:HD-like signal output (HDOD) protein